MLPALLGGTEFQAIRRSPRSAQALRSDALFVLHIRHAFRHVGIGQSRKPRADAENRQNGDGGNGSNHRKMPEKPDHGGRGQGQNRQKRGYIRPRARRVHHAFPSPRSMQRTPETLYRVRRQTTIQ